MDFSLNGNYSFWEFKNCSANGSLPSRADEKGRRWGQRNTMPHIKYYNVKNSSLLQHIWRYCTVTPHYFRLVIAGNLVFLCLDFTCSSLTHNRTLFSSSTVFLQCDQTISHLTSYKTAKQGKALFFCWTELNRVPKGWLFGMPTRKLAPLLFPRQKSNGIFPLDCRK